MSLLSLKHFSVAYKKSQDELAVSDMSFELGEGESLAIVGESGSGKSSLGLGIMGLLPAQASLKGELFFEGHNIQTLKQSKLRSLRGRRMAMIFQDPMSSLNPYLSVGKQVEEQILLHRMEPSLHLATLRTQRLFEEVGLDGDKESLKAYPHQLSGGERQRVMIAMSLSCEPALLIADEPTTALDVTVQAQVLALIKSMQERYKMALLLITHDLSVAALVAKKMGVMQKGKLVEFGDSSTLLGTPKHAYTRRLLRAVPTMKSDRSKSLEWEEGKEFKRELFRPQIQRSIPLLEIANLHLRLEQHGAGFWAFKPELKTILNNVNLKLFSGEILGVVGESGCGKTTTMRAMLGLTPLKAQAFFQIKTEPVHPYEWGAGYMGKFIQLVFQDPQNSLDPRMTVAQILSEPIGYHFSRKAKADELIKLLIQVDLSEHYLMRYPHELSGGERQRVGIARALAPQPRILFCDEPVSALDVSTQASVLQLLLKLRHELGLSILFVSHDLSVVRYLADRVLVMKEGKIVEELLSENLPQGAKHPYTIQLLKAIPEIK